MATATISPGQDRRDIFDLAHTCKSLFLKYANPDLPLPKPRKRAELQMERFYVWASYLGVFSTFNASLDKRLEDSHEIKSLVTQLLSLMRKNLEFAALTDPDLKNACPEILDLPHEAQERDSIRQIQGTPSEALDAVEAAIDRLNKLGATIRKSSASRLDSRVRAFTDKHGDEDYAHFAKQIVHFRYRTAPFSLQDHLVVSMLARRQELRYMARHQRKLATPSEQQAASQPPARTEPRVAFSHGLQRIDEEVLEKPSNVPRQKDMKPPPARHNLLSSAFVASETNASDFKPTPKVLARLKKRDGMSIVSSSKGSRTFMADDIDNYPDMPKKESGKPDPQCPYCSQPLQSSDLVIGKWRRHVNKDLKPFVCLFENCTQTPTSLESFEIWASHMRDAHSMQWTRKIHKPNLWRCDVDHEAEDFVDETDFQDHLNSQHGDYSVTERQAIASSSKIPQRRARNICPLCNSSPVATDSKTRNEDAPLAQRLEKFQQLDKLARHIASHLLRLALDCSANLGVTEDDASAASTATSSGVNGNESHFRYLNNTSLMSFDNIPTPEFDEDWSSAETESLRTEPEELSPTDILHWPDVKAALKEQIRRENPAFFAELERKEETTSPDEILLHMNQQRLFGNSKKKPFWVVPFSRNIDFVGRESFLAELLRMIPPGSNKDDCQRTAIVGARGIGKTQIALEAAFRVRDTHPDCSVFWVSAANATSSENTFREIGRQLEIEGINEDLADVKSLVKVALSRETAGYWLLIVDGVEPGFEPSVKARQLLLSEFSPFSRKGSILFTTTASYIATWLDIPESHVITTVAFSRDESVELLQRNLKESEMADAEIMTVLLDRLVDLPLAIKQASVCISKTGMSTRQYLRHLELNRQIMITIPNDFEDPDHSHLIAEFWSTSFRNLSLNNSRAAKCMYFLSFLAEKGIPTWLLSQPLSGRFKGLFDRDHAIDDLEEYAFISKKNGLIDTHRPVQLAVQNYLQDCGEWSSEITKAMERLVAHLPAPEHSHRGSYYLPHAQAVLGYLHNCTERQANSSWSLFQRIIQTYRVMERYDEAEHACRQALELNNESLGSKHTITIDNMVQLAMIINSQRRHEEAEELSRRIIRQSEEALGREHGTTLNAMTELAMTLNAQQKYREAEEVSQQTLQLSEKLFGKDHLLTIDRAQIVSSVLISELCAARENGSREQIQDTQTRMLAFSEEKDNVLDIKPVQYFQCRWRTIIQNAGRVMRIHFRDAPLLRIKEIEDEEIRHMLYKAVLDGNLDRFRDGFLTIEDRIFIFMELMVNLVFGPYLFGIESEIGDRLRSIEKFLLEVSNPRAVRQWRAVACTLFSRDIKSFRQKDGASWEAVEGILARLQLMRVSGNRILLDDADMLDLIISIANVAIEMRCQRGEYILWPRTYPIGHPTRTITFDSHQMEVWHLDTDPPDQSNLSKDFKLFGGTSRSKEAASTTVRMVLFPGIAKKGTDEGVGDDLTIVCPMKVLMTEPSEGTD